MLPGQTHSNLTEDQAEEILAQVSGAVGVVQWGWWGRLTKVEKVKVGVNVEVNFFLALRHHSTDPTDPTNPVLALPSQADSRLKVAKGKAMMKQVTPEEVRTAGESG